jgi:flagellar motility protein MotE (MotC chaperone)
MKLRLLPLLILFCGVTLVVRLIEMASGSRDLFGNAGLLKISAAASEEATSEKEKKDGEESKEGGEGKKKEDESANNKYVTDKTEITNLQNNICNKGEFDQATIDVLNSLAKRREELNKQREELGSRENALRAAEVAVARKINDIRKLKEEVENLLKEYAEKEDAKISNLVSVYENMKPKDAAKIFEEFDMDALLQVVVHMKDTKVAPILSQMDATKAKEITMRMMDYRTIATPPIICHGEEFNAKEASIVPIPQESQEGS